MDLDEDPEHLVALPIGHYRLSVLAEGVRLIHVHQFTIRRLVAEYNRPETVLIPKAVRPLLEGLTPREAGRVVLTAWEIIQKEPGPDTVQVILNNRKAKAHV